MQIDPSKNYRILIVRLSALGDVAYALPALDALRLYLPDAHIAWAVEEASAGLLRHHPQLDEVIVVPRKRWSRRIKKADPRVLADIFRFRKMMRQKEFDLSIDLHGNLRSTFVTRLAGAGRKIGFGPACSKEHSHLFLTDRIDVSPALHKVERNLALLRELGVPADEMHAAFPPASQEDKLRVDKLLADNKIDRPFVLMHPGVSKFGSFKQWPPRNYAELAKRCAENGSGVLLSAGPGEEDLAAEIVAEADCCGIASGLSLVQFIELARRASVFVSSDTGPAQIAWLVGTPTVVLMGPKDPAIYGPLGEPHRKIVADLECRPCTKRTCPDNRCMKEITVDQVLQAVEKIKRT